MHTGDVVRCEPLGARCRVLYVTGAWPAPVALVVAQEGIERGQLAFQAAWTLRAADAAGLADVVELDAGSRAVLAGRRRVSVDDMLAHQLAQHAPRWRSLSPERRGLERASYWRRVARQLDERRRAA